jgi:hypothetical protein
MAPMLAPKPVPAHPVLPDIGKARMAKVDARIPDISWNERIGAAIQRAVALVGWTNKEAAAKVGVDDAEFGKWLSGGRRPQLDRLFAVEELREPVVVALAGMIGAEIQTEIRFPRRAA